MPQKASDGIVRARTILDCVLQLQRQGTHSAMQRLEQTEPDLANYLFETLSAIHQSLLELHAPRCQNPACLPADRTDVAGVHRVAEPQPR